MPEVAADETKLEKQAVYEDIKRIRENLQQSILRQQQRQSMDGGRKKAPPACLVDPNFDDIDNIMTPKKKDSLERILAASDVFKQGSPKREKKKQEQGKVKPNTKARWVTANATRQNSSQKVERFMTVQSKYTDKEEPASAARVPYLVQRPKGNSAMSNYTNHQLLNKTQ